jgi:hypothetical protein
VINYSANIIIEIYITIILPVVLCDSEIWSLIILREERKYIMRPLEKEVLRRIFGTRAE